MTEVKDFIKRNLMVIIALAAALISCAFVPVTDYTQYVDTDVIGILFCLMLVTSGFKHNNVLAKAMYFLIEKARIYGTRKALVILSLITYFLSMFVTNDASLIALVPIMITFFEEYPAYLIYAIVVQTIAANLGSMATPFGNPQNLLIFTDYGLTPAEFFSAMLPAAVFGLALVLILAVLVPNKPLVVDDYEELHIANPRYASLYAVLFVLVLLAVFGVLDVLVVFASVCVVAVIIEPKIFYDIDYGLLLTFIFFFIFVGNTKNISAVNSFVGNLVSGREFFAAVITSQFISNVPAAVMLTSFTDNWKQLLLGVDIGGLGTPIASMASLISLRIYSSHEDSKPMRFLGIFLLINFALLAIMYAFAAIFLI